MSKTKKTPTDFFNKFQPPLSEQWFSVGCACQFHNCDPNQLYWLMDRAGVRFARITDGVMYLDGNAMQKLVEVYNEISTEVNSLDDAKGKAACN